MPPSDTPFPHLPDIRYASGEIHDRNPYQWDNSVREKLGGIVIQQTLKGSVEFAGSSGTREVGEGEAMLFRHGENSRYGLGPASRRPYHLRFVMMTPGGGAGEIFDGIRAGFGEIVRMSTLGEASVLLKSVVEDFSTGRKRDRLALAETVYRLLLAIQREQMSATRGLDPVAYGRHLLESRFRSPRNLKEWAAEIGMSREHFCREFHRRHGETPAVFLRRLRLDHARTLLRTGNMPLEDVAVASGFASAQTFHRAYRRQFGHSPGSERKGSVKGKMGEWGDG